MNLERELESPIRYPNLDSQEFMTKRARWLVLLGFFLPGSAQALTGNKRLGRVGLTVTLVLGALVLITAVGLIFARPTTLTILTNSWLLFVLQWVMIFIALLWLILGIDTFFRTKISRVKKNWRLPVAALSIVLTFAPVLFAAWASGTIAAGRGAISNIFSTPGAQVKPVDGRYNILLLGADAGDGREGLRPDSISLLSVDAESGQSLIVGLPRELTGFPFPAGSPMQELHPNGFGNDWGCYTGVCYLNSIYSEVNIFDPEVYGSALKKGENPGIRALKEAVSGATGLTVQFYVLIDMQGFSDLIDALGGVQIDVLERLPIGGDAEGNNIDGWIEIGEQQMDGYTAQWYARSRYSTDDYDRMRRQRELQRAILDQMTPVNVLQRFSEIMKAGTTLVMTDIPEAMLGIFADLAGKAKNFEPYSVELTPPEINPEYPDYDYAHELVRQGVIATTPVPDED